MRGRAWVPRSPGAILICACAAVGAPPARATTCTAGPFIIFFDAGSSAIDSAASEILDTVVSVRGGCGGDKVLVQAHSDTAGGAQANLRLSRLRAERVRAVLIAHRFPAALVKVEAHGETSPMIKTADGVAERRNRRAEITYLPVGGW